MPSILKRLQSLQLALDARSQLQALKDDLTVLQSIWFKTLEDTDDHQRRLEAFYSGQAHAYDAFRARFLHGRRPMLAACAARLRDLSRTDLVWVDLGGGTGHNVELMGRYIDLGAFKRIVVVDLCPSLCAQARKKVAARGWLNVEVVEGDACSFVLPEGDAAATLVTFSYSLSMIPDWHAAVDRAVALLERPAGLLGVADFYVSAKYDLPLRQHSWARRFFWRSVFDTDGIDLGPERRQYLDHCLSRLWEFNGEGPIPYVPCLRAPFYVWVGHVPASAADQLVESKVEAPPLFPPTFIYTQSWEDPLADEPHLQIKPDDVCLTLTSGGCNSLHLCINGAREVYSVDCNPAQNALLELKRVAIARLGHGDVWALFGEGKHPRAAELYERELAPFLSQAAQRFWAPRLRYFQDGLYYQGGMGKVSGFIQGAAAWLGMGARLRAAATAPTLEAQRAGWEALWLVRLLRALPAWLLTFVADLAGLLLFNRFTLWFGAGIPWRQYQLIRADGVHLAGYVARTFDGVGRHSHVAKDNWFYLACLTGRYAPDCCPAYLTPSGFQALKEGALDALSIVDGFFLPTLKARTYTKVILMDHLDWLGPAEHAEVAAALAAHVRPGGVAIWRSAARAPPYAEAIRAAGFSVRCVARADRAPLMDRVNSYASFWVANKKAKEQ